MIDRYSRWLEAIPMQDMTAPTVARAFFNNWISRFGSPALRTTDQGRQFKLDFFAEPLKIMGIDRIHTTPYHPRPNGLVEKWHRHLKASLMCCTLSTEWNSFLPSVLLGLHTAVRLDTGLSPAVMLFGQALRIPGDFRAYDEPEIEPATIMNEFRRFLRKIKPVPTPHKSKKMLPNFKPFYFANLNTCSHVLKLVVKVKPPLVSFPRNNF